MAAGADAMSMSPSSRSQATGVNGPCGRCRLGWTSPAVHLVPPSVRPVAPESTGVLPVEPDPDHPARRAGRQDVEGTTLADLHVHRRAETAGEAGRAVR